ncbi:hypothetical protein [Bernardetia sp.]|uniref:hypothetical protein n=1 Tax=Bernardetia sp. TaxID=1937974 RepID=UPI0025C3DE2C|nr:hypothetical protein [Bernardetia sp.]
MKLVKDFSRIALVAALACTFVFTSCKKDEEETDCGALASKVQTTSQAYASDPSNVEKCNAYKAALQAYISGCGEGTDLASFETALEFLTCD